jgi:xylan 1,4-beta-xylosidase
MRRLNRNYFTDSNLVSLWLCVGFWFFFSSFVFSGDLKWESAVTKTVEKNFKNPILTGFHPDPSICRVGEDFYLTNSTFEFFPGLPIYHSRDLVHWECIGNALDRPSQLPLKGASDRGGLYAPTLRYWRGTFYLTCDNVSGGGNFIVTAKDPAGPWSEPVWLDDYGIDGSMFFDDDGKIYYQHAGADNGNGVAQAELDPATLKLKTPFKKIWEYQGEWNEGPHLYKIKGIYYLISATGGTESHHQEVAARAKSPWGPFEPCPHNPILTERDDPQSPIQCAGHADLIDAVDRTWWLVFLGTRPKDGVSVLGRETFLSPVQWTGSGWPVVGKDHHVALEMEAPRLKLFAVKVPNLKTVFSGSPMGPEWLHIRNFDPQNFSMTERKGYLRVRAAKDGLNTRFENPAFVGQRQRAFQFSARTEMEFEPARDGEEAGLCVRANEDNHYEIGVGRFDGKTEIFVRNRVKNREYRIAEKPMGLSKVQLEISGTEDRYQFAWSADGKAWNSVAASPSADLAREKAGGFTGAVIGLYATANGRESPAYADFAWFEQRPGAVPAPIPLARRPSPVPLVPSDHWRVRSSWEDYQDKKGQYWSSDVGYEGGDVSRCWNSIGGTQEPEIYQSERSGPEIGYAFPVLPGHYRVRLLFAETQMKKEGERSFDILINGKRLAAHFDILKEAGGPNQAIDKEFRDIHPDADGNIHIQLVASGQDAKVCAIEIIKQD